MKYMLSLCLITITFFAKSQDRLTLKSGEEINSKVLEITPSEVKYKPSDNPNGPLIVIMKSDVFMIKYENGKKEVFNVIAENPPVLNLVKDSINSDDAMIALAEKDASENYTSAGSAIGTGIVTLINPLVGLIPASICSTTSPQVENLNYPNEKLMKNESYAKSYRHKAREMKSTAVWTTFIVFTVVDIMIYGVLLSK